MTGHPQTAESVRLLREYFRTPRTVGAVAPCAPGLAHEMICEIDWPRAHTLVELGPGTGAVSSRVIATAPPTCRIVLVEQNRRLCDVLRRRHPSAEVVTATRRT